MFQWLVFVDDSLRVAAAWMKQKILYLMVRKGGVSKAWLRVQWYGLGSFERASGKQNLQETDHNKSTVENSSNLVFAESRLQPIHPIALC